MAAWRCTPCLWPIAGINHPEARTDDPRGEPCRWWPASRSSRRSRGTYRMRSQRMCRRSNRWFSVKAWRAVQATCFDLGAPDLRLERQIGALVIEEKLAKNLQEPAHSVRVFGNEWRAPRRRRSD